MLGFFVLLAAWFLIGTVLFLRCILAYKRVGHQNPSFIKDAATVCYKFWPDFLYKVIRDVRALKEQEQEDHAA